MFSIKKMAFTTLMVVAALPAVISAPPPVSRDINTVESHISHSGGLVTLTGTLTDGAATTATASPTAPKSLSGTRGGDAAVCTEGVSASKQHDSSYPILDYTNVIPTQNWTSYSVKEAWSNEHFISGPHYMAFTHKMGQYGAYKCQYTCNSANRCNSFFVWFVNVNTPDEHMNCVLFNAVVPQAEFAPSNGTIAGGAYDRLCERPSSKSP